VAGTPSFSFSWLALGIEAQFMSPIRDIFDFAANPHALTCEATCRHHDMNPQLYLTQLLINLNE
jgi:hypothetical protein